MYFSCFVGIGLRWLDSCFALCQFQHVHFPLKLFLLSGRYNGEEEEEKKVCKLTCVRE